jgi:hypothetical protein
MQMRPLEMQQQEMQPQEVQQTLNKISDSGVGQVRYPKVSIPVHKRAEFPYVQYLPLTIRHPGRPPARRGTQTQRPHLAPSPFANGSRIRQRQPNQSITPRPLPKNKRNTLHVAHSDVLAREADLDRRRLLELPGVLIGEPKRRRL